MSTGNVTVYYTDITECDAAALLASFGNAMEPKRLTAIHRVKNTNVKKQMICAGALIVKVLEEWGYRASDIAYKEHGKPYLPASEDFFFNLSHSGNLIMLAVGNTELGADIQKDVSYRESLVNRITQKCERIGREEEYREHLNRVWAIKESFTKLTGEGIGLDFSTILYENPGDYLLVTCDGRRPAFCKPVCVHSDYEAFVCTYSDFIVTAKKTEL